MRYVICLMLFGLPTLAIPKGINWDESSVIKADIDCDGMQDEISLGYIDKDFIVRAKVSSVSSSSSQLRFGLAQSGRQDAICVDKAELVTFSAGSEMIAEVFGEIPEGYVVSSQCPELIIDGGDCDSIHIFWDHRTNSLSWWRL